MKEKVSGLVFMVGQGKKSACHNNVNICKQGQSYNRIKQDINTARLHKWISLEYLKSVKHFPCIGYNCRLKGMVVLPLSK